MPSLDEFFSKKEENVKPYNLESLGGVRPCSMCDEDVNGALWDPVEYIMEWTCSAGHKTEFKVN